MMVNMEEFCVNRVSILVVKFTGCNKTADRLINRFI